MSFDKRQTNIAKGAAVLLLLWHHLFYNSPDNYNLFKSLYVHNSVPVECFAANFAKVCVAVFLILSGYGLTKSYTQYCYTVQNTEGVKNNIKQDVIYVKKHWLQLMSNYWFVYIIFVPTSLLFGRKFYVCYANNPINYISDFLGISNLVNGDLKYTMNPTWWYMGVCTVYYLLFPLLYKLLKKYPEAFLLFSFLLIELSFDYVGLLLWLFPFVLGMYFAKNDLFVRVERLLKTNSNRALVCCISVLVCAGARYLYSLSMKIDGFFGLSIILFSYMILSKIKVLDKILEELGKNSGLIFMFHTFIYSFWFKEFIYGFKYSLLIYIVMVVICCIVAVILRYIMKITKYDELFKKITTVKRVETNII